MTMIRILLHIVWITELVLWQASSQRPDSSTFCVYIATVVEDELLLSCGGSLISSKVVLTSARCISPYNTAYIFAGSPSVDLALFIVPSSNLSQGQMRKASNVMQHKKFRPEQNEYDVALVTLDEKLTFEDNVFFLELTSYWARIDDPVQMFGWERSAPGSLTMMLRQSQTRIVCRSWGKDLAQPGAWDNLNIFTDGVLFVKDEMLNKSMCYGDTGSPLIVRNNLIGVASFGIDYDCKGLNAFTSIRRHLRWIEMNKLLLEGQSRSKSQSSMLNKYTRNKKEETLLIWKDFSRKNSSTISSMRSRISNGTRIVSPETFPFLVGIAVYHSNDPAKFVKTYCTGSILRIVDLNKFTEEGTTFQAIKVANYSIHPGYIQKYNLKDIGHLLLSYPLKLNAQVSPICQLAKSYSKTGTTLYIAGWGKLLDETKPSYPSWTTVTVMDVPDSHALHGLIFLDTLLKPSPCGGDSGAPYFNKDHELIGVHSFNRPLHPDNTKSCPNNGTAGTSASWYRTYMLLKMNELEEQISTDDQK